MPVGAHRDAVADADGVEAHADHAGGDDAFLDLCRPASFRCMLQVLPSYQTLAMPTCGLCMSASVRPVP